MSNMMASDVLCDHNCMSSAIDVFLDIKDIHRLLLAQKPNSLQTYEFAEVEKFIVTLMEVGAHLHPCKAPDAFGWTVGRTIVIRMGDLELRLYYYDDNVFFKVKTPSEPGGKYEGLASMTDPEYCLYDRDRAEKYELIHRIRDYLMSHEEIADVVINIYHYIEYMNDGNGNIGPHYLHELSHEEPLDDENLGNFITKFENFPDEDKWTTCVRRYHQPEMDRYKCSLEQLRDETISATNNTIVHRMQNITRDFLKDRQHIASCYRAAVERKRFSLKSKENRRAYKEFVQRDITELWREQVSQYPEKRLVDLEKLIKFLEDVCVAFCNVYAGGIDAFAKGKTELETYQMMMYSDRKNIVCNIHKYMREYYTSRSYEPIVSFEFKYYEEVEKQIKTPHLYFSYFNNHLDERKLSWMDLNLETAIGEYSWKGP